METTMQNLKDTTSKTLIFLQNLTKLYGKNQEIKAVDGINLEIYEGETFGLLGPNGAGKTTTIRILNSIIKPTHGSASIAGHDIITDAKKVKEITGLLAESPGIYQKLTPVEFLEFMGALYHIPKAQLTTRIEGLLKFFLLYDRKDYLLEGFSTGMKQKVLIAAALIHNPSVIFFDEPTAGLDPRAAAIVKDLIYELAKQEGKTVIISSHILPIIEDLCDRIGIIYQGKLIIVGTLEEILDQTNCSTLEEAFISLTGGKSTPGENWSEFMS